MHLIPAFEYDEQVKSATITSGSNVITLDSVTNIVSGQVIYGAGIPYNSRVVSIVGLDVEMSQNATASSTSSVSFFKRIDFDYPAESDKGPQLSAIKNVTKSLSGVQQTVTNYLEEKRKISFNFVTKTLRDALIDDFSKTHLILGKPFRFLQDKEVNSHVIYESDSNSIPQDRTIKKHPDFLYKIDFDFRRAL